MKRLRLIIFIAFLLALLLCGCAKNDHFIDSFEQLKKQDMTIAVSVGAPEESLVRKDFSEANILTYPEIIPAYSDVANGRVDAVIYARIEMELAMEHGISGVRLLDDTYCNNTIAVGISRVSGIPDLKDKINQFIQELQDEGILDNMYDRWVVRHDLTMPDIAPAEDPDFTLYVATTGTIMPYSFYIGNELAGYDIELAQRFASWLGAELKFKIYDFGGILAAAQSGDVDCIMSNLFYTPEHEEAIDFSDPLFQVEITAMVKGEASGTSLWHSISSGFEKTFIRESRWKLFLEGICTTLLITVLSILFGTILGFAVFLLCRNGNPVANTITRFCIWLVQGMPVVVLLMILYYIVFQKVPISGTFVSVIGFTLIFGAAVFTMIKAGVMAVDKGQTEAAYALGYSGKRTFFRIILPQAMPHIMPAFTDQVTALIKATAVVGYIAVQDLTKIGDLIRGRTYDAFFPLIAIAVFYFLLAALLTFLVRRISRRFEMKQRKHSSLLKGVNLHD